MKKLFISILVLFIAINGKAQTISAPEPEFINSYCILTSDSTFDILPKESGIIGKHQNKTKKILGNIGKVADVVTAAGGLGMMIGVNTGSITGALTGLKAAGTASAVASTVSSVSGLAGSEGMDVIFKGKTSSYIINSEGGDIRLLVKGADNEQDPMDIYRIVRFNTLKKERRIQWMELEPSLLGSVEAKKGGYVSFTGHKHGEKSYVLTIPASEIEKGEYGIFYMSIITANAIPVGTFSVQ